VDADELAGGKIKGRLRRPSPDFPMVGQAGGASAPTTTPGHSRPYLHRFSLILATAWCIMIGVSAA